MHCEAIDQDWRGQCPATRAIEFPFIARHSDTAWLEKIIMATVERVTRIVANVKGTSLEYKS